MIDDFKRATPNSTPPTQPMSPDVRPPVQPVQSQPTTLPTPALVSTPDVQHAPSTTPMDSLPQPQSNLFSDLNTPPKKKKWLKWLLIILATVIILLGALAAGAVYWYQQSLQPKSADTTKIVVVVKQGTTIEFVAGRLEEKSVIRNGLAFRIYMKLNNKQMKAGVYSFKQSQSVEEIANNLNDGKVDMRAVTILPGKTLSEIKAELVDSGYKEADVTAALAKKYDHKLFADKPATADLEGYIYPETYYIGIDSTVEQLLTTTFDEFYKQIEAKDLIPALKAKGFNLYQGITLASIITREVSSVSEQPKVAQVFELRLAKNMVLGSDVTYQYIAKKLGITPSADINSPYNTRKFPGLPPGPISNINVAALQAVANPAAGDYLYFVAGDDGNIYYARTNDEHEANVSKYCQKLCSTY